MYINRLKVKWIETGPTQHIFFTDNINRPIATGEYEDKGDYVLVFNDELATFPCAIQAFSFVNEYVYKGNS